MAFGQAQYVTQEAPAELAFSVCTLVASDEKYRRLLASFERLGFHDGNAEFIALDNRTTNSFDGYQALRSVFPRCRGEFILYTHDDIELIDEGADDLLAVLRDLERRDPRWTVAGNAGWSMAGKERLVLHLRDPHGSTRDAPRPIEVQALDENLMILPRARMVFPSLDLEGFHLFGADLCLQGRMAGGRAYVIPFYVQHHSGGQASAALEESRARFAAKYAALSIPARVRTPAARLYIGARGRLLQVIDGIADRIDAVRRRIAWAAAGRRLAANRDE